MFVAACGVGLEGSSSLGMHSFHELPKCRSQIPVQLPRKLRRELATANQPDHAARSIARVTFSDPLRNFMLIRFRSAAMPSAFREAQKMLRTTRHGRTLLC